MRPHFMAACAAADCVPTPSSTRSITGPTTSTNISGPTTTINPSIVSNNAQTGEGNVQPTVGAGGRAGWQAAALHG